MLTVRTSTVRQDLKRIGCVSPVSIDQLANYLINQALFSFTIGIKFTFCCVPLAGSLQIFFTSFHLYRYTVLLYLFQFFFSIITIFLISFVKLQSFQRGRSSQCQKTEEKDSRKAQKRGFCYSRGRLLKSILIQNL